MNERLPRRKQGERSGEARRKLLAATVELVGERGLDGFTLAEVGERAGVSRALPGHYFKTRDQLVDAAVDELLKPPGLPADGGLEVLLASLARSLGRLRSVRVRALVAVLSDPASQTRRAKAIGAYIEGGERLLEARLRAGIEAGTIKSGLDPVHLARFVTAAVFGEALAAGADPPEVTKARRDAFLDTVRQLIAVDLTASAKSVVRRKRPAAATEPRGLFD
jgi:AcrR family transcriptional regulator